MAPDKDTCESLWLTMPSLACVWWPSQFARKRPSSLYNDMFSRVALAFFEARKLLLERLILHHRLNVLHLDGDTIWFANPYAVFKTMYKHHQLIVQTDNPFANAGVFYVQNVREGDGAAWVLQELNRRIHRFTYHPESVQQLPNTQWAAAPPFFANADEQANLNDVIASSLSGSITFSGGVEFMEARFRERFAPRKCFARVDRIAPSDRAECDSVNEARKKMRDGGWKMRLNEGGAIQQARRSLRGCSSDTGFRFRSLTHLCQRRGWLSAREGTLRWPGNASAPTATIALAPSWLFSHFPYGSFFDDFRQCHGSGWAWAKASLTERRLCMPSHRVPAFMVHLAGLRQESWGRRTLMRALGVWQDAADAVAPEAWGVASPTEFVTMGDYDRFAARLLLLGLVLRRRAVMPPIDCNLPFMRKALMARHLRGMEVGCGASSQCVWLPYPHHIEPLCAGLDWLWDADYRMMQELGEVQPGRPGEIAHRSAAEFVLSTRATRASGSGPLGARNASIAALLAAADSPERILHIHRPKEPPTAGFSAAGAATAGRRLGLFGSGAAQRKDAVPLGWLPLGGFRTLEWKAPFPRRLEASLRAPQHSGGLGLSDSQVTIVKTCLKSLATSRE